MKLDVLVDIH